MMGAEAVHLLLEYSHPQVFAQELKDVQLLPEGQHLLGQPGGPWRSLGPGWCRGAGQGPGGEAQGKEEGRSQAGSPHRGVCPPHPGMARKGPGCGSCLPRASQAVPTSTSGPGLHGSSGPPGQTGSSSVPERPGREAQGPSATSHWKLPGVADAKGTSRPTCPSLSVQRGGHPGGPSSPAWPGSGLRRRSLALPCRHDILLCLHMASAALRTSSPVLRKNGGLPQAQLHPCLLNLS